MGSVVYFTLDELCSRAGLGRELGFKVLESSGIRFCVKRNEPTLTGKSALKLLPLLKTAAKTKREMLKPLMVLKNYDCVYFISDGEFVKIGVAREPMGRLKDLQVANARPLTLLFVIDGSFAEETQLHARFADYHKLGDWFRMEGELATFIKAEMQKRDTQSHGSPTHSGLNAYLADNIRFVSI